eukprot:COSAG06_NODE_8874_length_2044_cov_1.937789_1_plen_82_part_10
MRPLAYSTRGSALVPGLSLEGSIELEGKAGDCVVFTEALCAPTLAQPVPNPCSPTACRVAGRFSETKFCLAEWGSAVQVSLR